jgi:regulator of sigma E protease
LLTLIIFLFVLGLLIMVHELGHFLAAKKAGVRVDEFGFGFPPKLWSKKIGETTYSLNWIPFGGFVKILGENPDEPLPEEDKKRALTAKPKILQAWVLFAGVFCNFLLAWLLLSLGLLVGLPVESSSAQQFFGRVNENHLVVTSVLKNYPAGQSGIMAGDEIMGISAGEKTIKPLTAEEATTFIRGQAGHDVSFNIKRKLVGGVEERKISVLPKIEDKKAVVGVTMESVGLVRSVWYQAPWDGLKLSAYLTIETAKGLGHFFGQIFTSGGSAFGSVAGPVGLFGIIGDASKLGIVYLMSFVALLSINLAIINLVPFPALDGGRLLFIAIEAIIRRPLNPKFAGWANAIGFFLLIGLMVVISYFDVARLL